MRLIDSHCHLDRDDYQEDRPAVIERAKAQGLVRAVLIGLWRKPGDFGDALALRDADPDFFAATVGIHPHESAACPESDYSRAEKLAGDPRIVGVGETGLDYYYDHSDRPAQQAAFRRHIGWSRASRKPLVIHVRDAHADCARILQEEGAERGGIIHCFTGGPEEARIYLDLGFYLSFSGVVTFKNAAPVRESARLAPLDRILVETDSPFLAPVPHRGKRNEPAWVASVANAVAVERGMPVEDLAEATTANTLRAFGL